MLFIAMTTGKFLITTLQVREAAKSFIPRRRSVFMRIIGAAELLDRVEI